MAFTKYLAVGLAIVSTAVAATCSISSTTTITNPAGATDLAACTTFTGDIAMQTGSAEKGTVDLSTIEEIDGSFVYQGDAVVTTIKFGSLTKVVGSLTFQNLTQLSTLDLSSLSEVDDITWSGLGSLGSLGLSTGGLSKVGKALITDTKITSLIGLSNTTHINSLEVSNNQLLSDIEMAFKNLSGNVTVGVNDVSNGGVSVIFPNLVTIAGDLTIRNSTSISLPNLKTCRGNLGFYGNFFQNLTVPSITSSKGLFVNDNSKLAIMSFPALASINGSEVGVSGCQIANNTNLKAIEGFPILASVDGGLDFSGNFTSVKLPDLKHVSGAMNVQTSGTLDCDPINALASSQTVLGSITCASAVANPGTEGSTPTSSSGAGATSSAAAAPLNMPVVAGGASILGALIQVLFM